MEYELLKFFVTHPGKVFTREQLLSRVWGYEYYGGARTVDVHVRRLRAKLGEEHANLIQTVRSVGYRFGQVRWPGGWPRSRPIPEGCAGGARVGVVGREEADERRPDPATEEQHDRPDHERSRAGSARLRPRRGRYNAVVAHASLTVLSTADDAWVVMRCRPRLRSRPGRPRGGRRPGPSSARACGPERFAVDRVDRGEVGEVGDEDRRLGDVVERRAAVAEHGRDVGEHLAGLGLDAVGAASRSRDPGRPGPRARASRRSAPRASTGRRRAARSGCRRASTGMCYLRSRRAVRVSRAGNVSGRTPSARVSAFHVAAATAAKTASDARARGGASSGAS